MCSSGLSRNKDSMRVKTSLNLKDVSAAVKQEEKVKINMVATSKLSFRNFNRVELKMMNRYSTIGQLKIMSILNKELERTGGSTGGVPDPAVSDDRAREHRAGLKTCSVVPKTNLGGKGGSTKQNGT